MGTIKRSKHVFFWIRSSILSFISLSANRHIMWCFSSSYLLIFFFNLLKGKRSTDLVFAIWLLCCRSYVLCVTQNKKWVSDWQTDGSDNNMKIYQWVLIFLEYLARFNNNAFIVGCAWGSTFAPNASSSMTMYASYFKLLSKYFSCNPA